MDWSQSLLGNRCQLVFASDHEMSFRGSFLSTFSSKCSLVFPLLILVPKQKEMSFRHLNLRQAGAEVEPAVQVTTLRITKAFKKVADDKHQS